MKKNSYIYESKSYYDGNAILAALIKLGTKVLNIISLYVFYPFIESWRYKWDTKHTVLEGKRLYFDGHGSEIMPKWLLWWFLTIITLSICGFLIPKKMISWKILHTHYKN